MTQPQTHPTIFNTLSIHLPHTNCLTHIFSDILSIVTGGCAVGIESTVCRVSSSGDVISILRCGAVTSHDIINALRVRTQSIEGIDNRLAHVTVTIENEKALIKRDPHNNNHNHSESTAVGTMTNAGGSSSSVNGNSSSSSSRHHDDNHGNSSSLVSGHSNEGVGVGDGAVAPGQMIRHYAPDVATYIVPATIITSTTAAKTTAATTTTTTTIAAETVTTTVFTSSIDPSSHLSIPSSPLQFTIGGSEYDTTNTHTTQGGGTPGTEGLGSTGTVTGTGISSLSSSIIQVNESFVIDFGGRLNYLRSTCSVYCDLSEGSIPEEACTRLFQVLRQSEDVAAAGDQPSLVGAGSTVPVHINDQVGVTTTTTTITRTTRTTTTTTSIPPNVSFHHCRPNIPDVHLIITDYRYHHILNTHHYLLSLPVLHLSPSPALQPSASGASSTVVRVVLLPDLREDAERCEMTRALWERLHRAASGTFVRR